MAATESGRGIAKLLAKISQSLDEKKFYEAHQIYRTIYFRYSKQEKFPELADLLFDGAQKLIAENQYQSGSDLSLLLIEILQKCTLTESQFFSWMESVAKLIESIEPSVVERDTLVVRSIKWSSENNKENPNQGHPQMHKLIANILAKEKNYDSARYHYFLSKDGRGCANVLIQISLVAYNSEIDMVIAQSVLNLLVLKEKLTAREAFDSYTNLHPAIKTSSPPYRTPLLNFLYFLLHLIEEPKLTSFTTLCDLYKPAISRDPEFDRQLRKIGESYFGAKPARQAQSGGLFGGLFSQLFAELESDDFEEDFEDGIAGPQPSTSSQFRANTDLD